jgi:signal peptide peptidase SppA
MRLNDILNGPWAITPDTLHEIQGIYARHLRGDKIDLGTVEQRLGRPLNNKAAAYEVTDGVAVIPLDGVIGKKMNLFTQISGGVSTDLVARDFRAALDDPTVKAIILAIDSPGGTIDGTPDLAALVKSARGKKPVCAFTDGTMASAAYWIGSAADKIYISNLTNIVGSIGVVTSHTDYSRAEEAAGVKVTEIYAGKYKRIASEHAPLSDEGKAYMQASVDHAYSIFVDAVAEHRGVTAEEVVQRMADGRIFRGDQAITAGLVDGVSTMQALIQTLARKPQPTISTISRVKLPDKENAIMTTEQIKTAYPELVAELMAEVTATHQAAVTTARLEGAAAERNRIKGIDAAAIPGHEALIEVLKYDGKSTAAEAALQILGAEKALRAGAAQQLVVSANPPVATVGEPPPAQPAIDPDAPVEDRAKAEWDTDKNLRAEFGGEFSTYLAFKKSSESGLAKIMKKL